MVCYHVPKSLPLIPTLSQINPAQALPSYFIKMHFTVILPSILQSSKQSLSFRFPHQTTMKISLLPDTGHLVRHSSILIWNILFRVLCTIAYTAFYVMKTLKNFIL